MDKLKYVKIENEDGSLSDNIPLGVDAENVDVTSEKNSQNLADYINENDGKINSINLQINDLQDKDISLSNQIKSLSSGSPKGSYETVSALKSANPETGVYVIQEDGHIYSWTKNSSDAIDLGLYQAVTYYQGNIIDLGYTTFEECQKDGYYNFGLNDLPSINDKPNNLDSGGILIVYENSATNVIFQQIINIRGEQWFRYGNHSFYQIYDKDIAEKQMLYRGNLYLLNYTHFSQCVELGYYNFSENYLTSIVDRPVKLNTGGIIKVEIASNTDNYSQTIIDINGNIWFRSNLEDEFKELLSIKSNYSYRGNMEVLKKTSFSDCLENGFYNFLTDYIVNITDKPENLDRAGVLRVENPQDIGVTMQTIQDVNGNIWFRYVSSNLKEWTQIFSIDNFNNEKPRWCAMGDSITEGYYSLINEQEEGDYALDKSKGWINYVANLCNYNVTNNAEGGTGYVNSRNSRPNAVEKVKEINFTDFDFVTLAYGVNDWKYNQKLGTFEDDIETGGTFYSNMRKVIEYIQNDNPNIKIIVITPLNCMINGTFESNWGLGYNYPNNGTLEDIYDAIVKVCKYYGIEYIDMTHNSIVNRLNIQDLLLDKVIQL